MQQIIIPIENRPGELANVTGLLAKQSININTIEAMDQPGAGFIIITVDLYDDALRHLREAGYKPLTEDSIVIEVTDEPGALAKVANRFREAQINLRSLHIIRRNEDLIHVSLVSDNNEKARELVNDLLLK